MHALGGSLQAASLVGVPDALCSFIVCGLPCTIVDCDAHVMSLVRLAAFTVFCVSQQAGNLAECGS